MWIPAGLARAIRRRIEAALSAALAPWRPLVERDHDDPAWRVWCETREHTDVGIAASGGRSLPATSAPSPRPRPPCRGRHRPHTVPYATKRSGGIPALSGPGCRAVLCRAAVTEYVAVGAIGSRGARLGGVTRTPSLRLQARASTSVRDVAKISPGSEARLPREARRRA